MKKETMREAQQREVDANYEAFKQQLPKLLSGQYAGKHALIKNQKMVDFFDTSNDAFYAGVERFKDGIFSVQKVTDEVIDLRLWRYALSHSIRQGALHVSGDFALNKE
ncbi:MAG: hypothetical protein ACNYPH_07295 [Gammaproteobacteria bacterium WSBS_2016_MAG_OTU1]